MPDKGGENIMTFKNHIQKAQIAEAVKDKKTNKDWYAFETWGSYFKLENGVLLQCPMMIDGTRDDSPCEVEWGTIDADGEQWLKAVFQVLAANP